MSGSTTGCSVVHSILAVVLWSLENERESVDTQAVSKYVNIWVNFEMLEKVHFFEKSALFACCLLYCNESHGLPGCVHNSSTATMSFLKRQTIGCQTSGEHSRRRSGYLQMYIFLQKSALFQCWLYVYLKKVHFFENNYTFSSIPSPVSSAHTLCVNRFSIF